MTTNTSHHTSLSLDTKHPPQKGHEQKRHEQQQRQNHHHHHHHHQQQQQQGGPVRLMPVEFECANCGKRAYNMKSCTRCWWAKYCNRECQGSHWGLHKRECQKDVTRSQYYK
ncbi:unnamed protein product, partial [Candidula unifasciata]